MRETQARYDGPAGALLPIGSLLSLHAPLVGRLLIRGDFDVSTPQRVLDIGSGAGQILQYLVRHSRPECHIVGFDLSTAMLERARERIGCRPSYIGGDVCALPFADQSFDGVTCGWVLEHVPNPQRALGEIARVLRPGGQLLLLATEDTWAGRALAYAWKCRTYKREDIQDWCEQAGLTIAGELWLTPLHRMFGMGGILLRAEKRDQHRFDPRWQPPRGSSAHSASRVPARRR